MTAKYTIAIDGPAGAGKSTIAKLLAKKLNIMYLDTGAMYRAFALKVLEAGLDPEVKTDVEKVVDQTEISIEYENGTQRVYLDKRDVTDEIRSEQVSKAASAVAVIPEVRKKLVQLQRRIAATNNLVMDGRDIGTYVLPDADLKIFLTASAEERARRRWSELRSRGLEVDFESVLSDIIKRDHNDSNREFAPLKKADDAVLIDTTDKSIQEVVEQIESLVDFRR
ncbi:MAG TPA: (d)CMP kinase [Clostridiales bacterium]|nr:(d)CMP kinase [Candidatus Atribacteria bacterium]HPT79459.1 (d)CMP kinase [Candidatus Atribacteria bacterium]HPZ06015.1 (d)CMP kinase [Clostridiales bacterium]